jgi:hypothetical protein
MRHCCPALVNTSIKKHSKQATRRTMLAVAIIFVGILMAPGGTRANDSTAALGVGGIELLKSEHIRILEELLEISAQNVRVKYRFLNESGQDIHTKVAFPLPFYDGIAHSNVSIGDPNAVFATFKVSVNNSPVVTQSERKAELDGRDITDKLRALGLSDKEIFFEVHPGEKADLWLRLEPFKLKVGNWWDISQTIFWDMTFPAGKETVVEHEYEPATGAGFAIVGNGENLKRDIAKLWSSFTGKDDRENEDCLDETTKRAIENRVKMAASKGAESVEVHYRKVKYILGTGRNWKGPIGEFRLRLVKEKPDQFVSVCFPGKPMKISPTIYEFHQKDFVPQDKLITYFYAVEPASESSK